ncbi:unnamed protein product [Tenebrio molitor]|nr:unnamed protein product [Tenebrio molitor]
MISRKDKRLNDVGCRLMLKNKNCWSKNLCFGLW